MKQYKIVVYDNIGRVVKVYFGYGGSEKQVRGNMAPTLEAIYGKKPGEYSYTILPAKKRKNPCGTRSNPRKSMKQFISENRADIDAYIRRKVPSARIDDAERRLWILNDEGLYNYARSEGVNI